MDRGQVTHSFDLVDIMFLVGIEFRVMKRRGRRHGGRWVVVVWVWFFG